MTDARSARTDDPLRANVRLLGEVLGDVIVEQAGEELLAVEERLRLLARAGRNGDAAAGAELAASIGALGLGAQALVLRAFRLFFPLANIAEQHHRGVCVRTSTRVAFRASRCATPGPS